MYDSNSKGISYTAGFFILIGFAIAGLFLGAILSLPVWTAMTGKSILAMKDEMNNAAFSNAFKVIQVISAVFGFLIPAIVTAVLLNRKPYRLLGFTKKISPAQIFLVFAVMVAALFASGLFGYFNQLIPISPSMKAFFDKLEKEYNTQVEAIVQLRNLKDYLISIFLMGFLPALCEESLFRGGFQNFLTRATNKPWLAIIVVSILFSAVHLSWYGFLPRFFLGVMLGLIYYHTQSLWLSVLAHFVNNAIAVSLMYYYVSHGKTIDQASDQMPPWQLGVLGFAVSLALIIVLIRISPKPQPQEALTLGDIRDKAPWEKLS